MAPTKELKLVVKHTFLEYPPSCYCDLPQRQRSQTDPEAFATVQLENNEAAAWSHETFGNEFLGSQVLDTPEATPLLLCPLPQHAPPFLQLEESMLSTSFSENIVWNNSGCGWYMTVPDEYHYGWANTCGEQVPARPLQVARGGSPASHSTAASSTLVDETPQQEWRTTVMLRDVPESYTRADLLKVLDREGFFGRFDFAYLPIDFKSHNNLGYALINMVTTTEALRLFKHFEGFCNWGACLSSKTCSVQWCNPHQGLEVHVERYRNSPVMHESVSPEWQPLLLSRGVPVAFPPPTMKIKAPKVKGMKC